MEKFQQARKAETPLPRNPIKQGRSVEDIFFCRVDRRARAAHTHTHTHVGIYGCSPFRDVVADEREISKRNRGEGDLRSFGAGGEMSNVVMAKWSRMRR